MLIVLRDFQAPMEADEVTAGSYSTVPYYLTATAPPEYSLTTVQELPEHMHQQLSITSVGLAPPSLGERPLHQVCVSTGNNLCMMGMRCTCVIGMHSTCDPTQLPTCTCRPLPLQCALVAGWTTY